MRQRTRFHRIFTFLQFFHLFTPPEVLKTSVLKMFPTIPPIVTNTIPETKSDSFISRHSTSPMINF